jgi:hypothetical protein
MPNFRNRDNGDKFTVARGSPPSPPMGYYRDEKDPYLFHPILNYCEYYVPFREKLSCGKLDIGIFCDNYEKIITGGDCLKCQKNG